MAKAQKSLVATTVAITGAARGIGRATAQALIAQGARVAIGDIDEKLVRQTAAERGNGTVGLPVDVTDRASFTAFLDATEQQLGPIEVLVNNAGIMPVGPFLDETDVTARRIVDINVHGVILGSKLALERFLPRRRGHLVNIASIAGKGGAAGGATYAATKHAVVGLTESLIQEYHGMGIEFSIVMPIGVNTELYSGMAQIRGFKTPEPEDVAAAIVEALQRPRVEVYVPKSMQPVIRSAALLPHRAAEAVARFMRVDKALTHGNAEARSAYQQRMDELMSGATPTSAVEGKVESDDPVGVPS
jgi:NAD(P)-dependent dehydrogenase (short-subunit alcohol dehydrogenase family)